MTSERFRPVVAIEVTGLLGLPLPQGLAASFLAGTGAEITFRRGCYPSRFLREPRWDEHEQYAERWAFFGRGASWVRELLGQGVEVVWASRYQEHANTHFSSVLGLPELPVAARDDGRYYTSEAGWKALQLGHRAYAARPLLWVNDELPALGRHLLELQRAPAMRALTWTKYVPDSPSDGDVRFMNEWLELTQSPSGQNELRSMRARFTNLRRRGDFSTERLHREWLLIRSRLGDVVDFRSPLVAPLATYAVEHAGELDALVVARIREEWGLPLDPPAKVLLPLLQMSCCLPGAHAQTHPTE
jgi:hypothetical protein